MIYDNVDNMPNRRIAFITTNSEGVILSSTVSKNDVVTDRSGSALVLDDYVAEQITKFRFIDGKLVLIEGEELIPPVKTEKQLRMEELQRQMAELQEMPEQPSE